MNKNGAFQAKECGEYLKTYQWDVIITSPLQRAKQTIKFLIFLKGPNLKVGVPWLTTQ
ncbi:hypothetical protein TMU01_03190 [Tenuibacillus multivorans]|nr:hypothetical protein TMU01_03190 [Tenuibacillus multivorans]